MVRRFAIVQETIRPNTLQDRLRQQLDPARITGEERALIEKLIQRNAAAGSVPLPSSLAGSLGALLVDPTSISRPQGRDLDAIYRQSQQLGRKLAWLALPAFSDDDQRAAVYMEWRGGFDDAGGEGKFSWSIERVVLGSDWHLRALDHLDRPHTGAATPSCAEFCWPSFDT